MMVNCAIMRIHELLRISEKCVIAIANGHGYEFNAVASEWAGWQPVPNIPEATGSISRYMTIYVHVHQDQNGCQTFFAFPTMELRLLALKMANADGFGLKSAITLFEKTPSARILEIVAAGDQEAFVKLPGLGPKKGPLVAAEVFKGVKPGKAKFAPNADLIQALQVMGLQKKEAEELARKAMEELPGADVATWLKRALQYRVK